MAPARRIAVTGGGTAGHILPALDFLETYRSEFGAEGCFIGSKVGMETRIVPARGERLEIVPGRPWARESWASRLRTLAGLPGAIRAAEQILAREGTQLVIGTGGYASWGVCTAARRLGLPVVIHESNAEPGMANLRLRRSASLVCVGFDQAARFFGPAALVTGTPSGGLSGIHAGVGPPWRFIVLGGSEGSPALNRDAPAMFAELRRQGLQFSVHHAAAGGNAAAIATRYRESGIEAQVDSFLDNMREVYEGASLAIATAGARTLAELASVGIPSLIVPLRGAARNHQNANARVWTAGAESLIISDWNPGRVADQILQIIRDPAEMMRMKAIATRNARPDAASDVVRACEQLLRSAAGFGGRGGVQQAKVGHPRLH